MTDENPDKGPLLELRQALDALDHDLLDLLVRRMDLVADVAAQRYPKDPAIQQEAKLLRKLLAK